MWCVYNEKTLCLYETAFSKQGAKELQAKWRRWASKVKPHDDKNNANDISLIKSDKLRAWRILRDQ